MKSSKKNVVLIVVMYVFISIFLIMCNGQVFAEEEINNKISSEQIQNNDLENVKEVNIENNKEETIKLTKTTKNLQTGDTYKLKVKGTNKKVKWSSSNKKVATVDSNGIVTAKSKGTAKIIAKVGKNKCICKIKVKARPIKGTIYLTFDDGPSSNITPKVLDILKKEKINATFFVINYSKSNEKLIKRIVKEGHTIAIHGYSHDYSKIYRSKSAFMNNVYSLQEKIKKSTGVKTMYMRFPGGSSNTVSRRYCRGIMTTLTKLVLNKGFKYFDWNISSGDAGGAKNSNDVYRNVTRNLSKKRGNLVLMHDFSTNQKGLSALPRIIKYAKKNGYTFAPIDDDTPMYAHGVNN